MWKKIIILICIFLSIVLGLIFFIKNDNKENKDNLDIHQYNIYVVNGTLPTLLVSMDLAKNSNIPSFIWYGREETLDKNEIKKNLSDVVLSDSIGRYNSLFSDLSSELKKYVSDVLKNDSKAHFNFIIDEYRNWLEFPVFLELGLSDKQYSVKYYSDGTLSYVSEYEILKDNSYDLFLEEKEKYFNLIDDVRNGKYVCDEKCDYLINPKIGKTVGLMDYEYDSNYILLATLRDNVEYFLQYPDLIKFNDKTINNFMKNANIKELNVKDKFDELSEEEKEKFFSFVKFNKKKFDNLYFNNEDNKYLIITGSRPFYGKYDKNKFMNFINTIMSKYGDEYKILYKPHPSALPNSFQTKYLKSKNISILPGQMPMEVISFVYDDLKLGGFPSSLYMNVDSNDVLFFFEDSKETLVSPLNNLYDDLFHQADIYN